ncbi:MAG: hypothetical protein QG591_460 [Planctomycetota bacterium]|nr:hypothetical protein [Planctomycetota bacterium]
MIDTDPFIESHYLEMMMKKSGAERLRITRACNQVVASIKRDNPNARINDIKRGIFLRFYGQDFSLEEQEKILNKLLSNCDKNAASFGIT